MTADTRVSRATSRIFSMLRRDRQKLPRDINGSSREVFSYTERDRRLFDQAFAEMFGAPAALPTDPTTAPANDAREEEGPTAA